MAAGYTTLWLAPVLVTGSLYSFPEEIEVSLRSAAGVPESAGPTAASSSMASGSVTDLVDLRARFGRGRGSDGARLRERLRAARMRSHDEGGARRLRRRKGGSDWRVCGFAAVLSDLARSIGEFDA